MRRSFDNDTLLFGGGCQLLPLVPATVAFLAVKLGVLMHGTYDLWHYANFRRYLPDAICLFKQAEIIFSIVNRNRFFH
ncbi:Uncharacterised protein [Serratia marcescens]|uniref:Uncharacterized protein n=1 Tax=Serratia marcescens TaxID=615 RepID=A0A379ZZW6_SERMA|nr:Uncharacterised protein [Serratia marcescens]